MLSEGVAAAAGGGGAGGSHLQTSQAPAEANAIRRRGLNWAAAGDKQLGARNGHHQQQLQPQEAATAFYSDDALYTDGFGSDGHDEGYGDNLNPQYVVDAHSGRPPQRPLLCGPGLVCTGDVEPMPNTCVKIRPPNTCYQVRRGLAMGACYYFCCFLATCRCLDEVAWKGSWMWHTTIVQSRSGKRPKFPRFPMHRTCHLNHMMCTSGWCQSACSSLAAEMANAPS